MMRLLDRIKPKFWEDSHNGDDYSPSVIDFRRVWRLAVIALASVAIVPLLLISFVDYNKSKEAMESEVLLRTSRFTSNTWRTVSFFLSERLLALDFIVKDNPYTELCNPLKLKSIKENLRKELGGFTDLGVIDSDGVQHTYVGLYDLQGINYHGQEWFNQVLERKIYISEVFLGFRNVPHLVLAVKHELPGDSFYVLRATLDMERFNRLLNQLEISRRGDAFIVNRTGVLQTPSRHHGEVLQTIPLDMPPPSDRTETAKGETHSSVSIFIGYRFIPDTSFVLMVIKESDEVMSDWFRTRLEMAGFLILSITLILVVILSMATYLVNRIYIADKRRLFALHQIEYSNKMAALGRLSAGVAHEINNPLAIINEKAGLIKDLFKLGKEYRDDPKLIGLVDSITSSVGRCAAITKRLLSFAKPMDGSFKTVNLRDVIVETLGFMGKEAEYRNIQFVVDIPDDVSIIQSDCGKLQQIFLNLISNSFAAMSIDGHLEIRVARAGDADISIIVSDDGCGMSEEEQKLAFEPFFSTRSVAGGTGLGLSITYNLVNELGGKISVESEKGVGTNFVITLPQRTSNKEDPIHESASR